MVTHRRHQVVAHAQRRDLFGRTWSLLLVVLACVLLTSAADTVLPNGDKTTATAATGTPTATAAATTTPTPDPGAGGIIGGLTSAIGDVTSAIGSIVSPVIPLPISSSSTQSLTASSTSSTSSSSTLTSSSTPSSTSTSSTSSTSTSTSSLPPTTTSSSTSALEDQTSTYLTTTNGQVSTVTATVAVSVPSASATVHAPQKSFLQNKPLAGTVFALVGVVGLVLLIALSTFAIRRTRRNKLERDAENFDSLFPDPDGYMGGATSSASGFPGDKRRVESNVGVAPTRSVSGRTAGSAGAPSAEGSEDGLLGGGAHSRTPSDGQETTTSHMMGAPMMQQLGQPITRFGPNGGGNMSGFTPLPAPPGLTGAQRPQQQQQQIMSAQRGYGYENLQRSYTQTYQQQPGYPNGPAPPSAVYTQGKPQGQGQGLSVNTSMPSPWDAKTSPSPIAPLPPFATQQQQHHAQGSQASAYSGGYGYGTPPPLARVGVQGQGAPVPPSSPSPTRSTSSAGSGTGAPRDQSSEHRPSESSIASSARAQNTGAGAGVRPLSDVFGAGNGVDGEGDEDAYADYAYATGPGQQGSAPRGLRVANA